MWNPIDNGATIGGQGAENGVIIRDDEHELGARITLERGCSNGVPFSVTCGVYGWFFHTRFLSSEAEAEYQAMREGLVTILGVVPLVDDPQLDDKMRVVGDAIGAFVDRFP